MGASRREGLGVAGRTGPASILTKNIADSEVDGIVDPINFSKPGSRRRREDGPGQVKDGLEEAERAERGEEQNRRPDRPGERERERIDAATGQAGFIQPGEKGSRVAELAAGFTH
jgi:hypothetical protein